MAPGLISPAFLIISHREALLDVVAGAGQPRDRAESLLNSNEGLSEVRAAEEEARRLGVKGVHFLAIDGELAVLWGQQTGGIPSPHVAATGCPRNATPAFTAD